MNGAWVIAHRGASDEAPENTEAAVRLALRQGCDAVECDVQLSLDRVPLVLHDPDLQRVGGGAEVAADCEARQLVGRPLSLPGRCGEPARLLSLEQWLELLPSTVLAVVEMKPQGCAARDRELARAVADRLRSRAQAAVISFGDLLVEQARRLLPGHRVGPIRNRPLDATQVQRVRGLAQGCAVLKKTLLDSALLEQLRPEVGQLWSYALDTRSELERARELGIEGWITNRPAQAVEFRSGSRRTG